MNKKNVLMISTSLRKNGNSDGLAQAFMKGVKEAGHDAKMVSLVDKKLNFVKDVYFVKNINHVLLRMMFL